MVALIETTTLLADVVALTWGDYGRIRTAKRQSSPPEVSCAAVKMENRTDRPGSKDEYPHGMGMNTVVESTGIAGRPGVQSRGKRAGDMGGPRGWTPRVTSPLPGKQPAWVP